MTRRIALVSEHASPLAVLGGVDCGGQNVYVAEVAVRLAAAGCRVDVFTRQDRGDAPTVYRWADRVRVINVPAGPPTFVRKEELLPFMPEFAAFMLGFMEAERIRYDVVHANFFMSGLVAADLKRDAGVPFVTTFHALGRVRRLHQGCADAFPGERIAIEERVVRETDRIIAECPQDADDLVTLYDAATNRMRIVPCGVDPARFHPVRRERARAVLGLPMDEPVVLQLGRMVPRKGVDDVLRSAGVLRQRHGLDARVLIVGGESETPDVERTPELARLADVAREAGVDDRVTFVGRRAGDALRYYYSAADVFVSAPWYEPFGITPIEAMACGTPVVGSRVGGIKYTVVDGETGYLVPPHDPDAIADRVARLLRAPDERAAFARNGIARVRSRFSWDEVVRQLLTVYDEVAGEQPSVVAPGRHLPLSDAAEAQA